MFKTFLAELKYLFSNKWRAVSLILLLFIPFIYGFLYMNAYWAPFKHVDRLKIAVVNRDSSETDPSKDLSKKFVQAITKDGAMTAGANQVYDIVSDNSIKEDPATAVDNGEYAAIIVIPNGYSKAMEKFATDTLATPTKFSENLDTAFQTIGGASGPNGTASKFDRVTFYFSYKHSYLSGEMVNFISTNTFMVLHSLFPNIPPKGTPLGDALNSLMNLTKTKASSFVSIEKAGNGVFNSYGGGLAPYFVSIALWAGALATLFIVKNERHIKTENTVKHMFGKWMVWVLIGWIQALILITGITLQGVDLGKDQWQLFSFALFMSTIFATLVMFVAYTMRYGDLGEFLVVILLVAQLISSSGTFPVEMQNIIFKIIHPVAPFTYTISAIREIMWATDITVLLTNMGILMLFPIAIVPGSLFINWMFDRKTVKTVGKEKQKEYESFEIHLGDY